MPCSCKSKEILLYAFARDQTYCFSHGSQEHCLELLAIAWAPKLWSLNYGQKFRLLTFHSLASNYGRPRAKMLLALQSLAPKFGLPKFDNELCRINSFLLLSLHNSMSIYGNSRRSKAQHQALEAWKHSCFQSSIVQSWAIWGRKFFLLLATPWAPNIWSLNYG